MKGGSQSSCRVVAFTTCSETLGVAGPPLIQGKMVAMYHHIFKTHHKFYCEEFSASLTVQNAPAIIYFEL